MKKYYIGIDGGGSNTVVSVGDESQILAQESFPASNYHTVKIETVKSVLRTAIDTLCEAAGVTKDQIEGICFGGAGVDTPEDEAFVQELFREIGYQGKLKIVNDGLIALVGANEKLQGAVLISGTGSIGIGVSDQKQYRVGGWGHIIGDEGSGYAIGRDALNAISKAADGRTPANDLFKTLSRHIGFNKPDDLIHFIYGEKASKETVAKLAPHVIDLGKTDEAARRIIDRSIDDLVDIVIALSHRMEKKSFQLAVSGSVLVKNDWMFEMFKKALYRELPCVSVARAKHHPVYGAIQMAREL